MDSGVLFGSKEMIEQRVRETAKAAKDMGVRHVMNLGHGIMQVSECGESGKQEGICLDGLEVLGSALLCIVCKMRVATLMHRPGHL